MVIALVVVGLIALLAFIGFVGCANRVELLTRRCAEDREQLAKVIKSSEEFMMETGKLAQAIAVRFKDLYDYTEILEKRHEMATVFFKILLGPPEENVSVVVDTDAEGMKN